MCSQTLEQAIHKTYRHWYWNHVPVSLITDLAVITWDSTVVATASTAATRTTTMGIRCTNICRPPWRWKYKMSLKRSVISWNMWSFWDCFGSICHHCTSGRRFKCHDDYNHQKSLGNDNTHYHTFTHQQQSNQQQQNNNNKSSTLEERWELLPHLFLLFLRCPMTAGRKSNG